MFVLQPVFCPFLNGVFSGFPGNYYFERSMQLARYQTSILTATFNNLAGTVPRKQQSTCTAFETFKPKDW